MYVQHLHHAQPIDGLRSRQSQLSQDAAKRHATLTALRERRGAQRHPITRGGDR